jgi:tRNA(Arg) A34 adenosine deaminase TadA
VGAIRDASQRLGTPHLRGCVLYTSSEPCPMCMGACYWARIDKIFYATTAKDVKVSCAQAARQTAFVVSLHRVYLVHWKASASTALLHCRRKLCASAAPLAGPWLDTYKWLESDRPALKMRTPSCL